MAMSLYLDHINHRCRDLTSRWLFLVSCPQTDTFADSSSKVMNHGDYYLKGSDAISV